MQIAGRDLDLGSFQTEEAIVRVLIDVGSGECQSVWTGFKWNEYELKGSFDFSGESIKGLQRASRNPGVTQRQRFNSPKVKFSVN
jgi:hypothetical protein